MSDQLKLAFIGCGAIARFHLDGIKAKAPRIQVTTLVDLDDAKAQAFAEETGGQVFTSLDEALAKGDFDAVDILLPHDLHEIVAIQCLRAGKHVLLEKPIAPTLDACDRIFAAAEEAHGVFMVAENSQYWPEIVTARNLIQEGTIGDVLTARAGFVMEFDDYWFKEKKPWRYEQKRTGGGVIIDGGSHWLRPLRMWMGEIDSVIGVIGHPMEAMEGESLTHAIFRFQDGKFATFHALNITAPMANGEWWRVTGTQGELVIDGDLTEGSLKIFNSEHPDGKDVGPKLGYTKSFGLELDDFASAVLNKTPLAATPEFSLGELRTALSIYRSAKSGRWEKTWD